MLRRPAFAGCRVDGDREGERLVRITLWDGNYAVCNVASVHVSYETKYLAIFVAIRVSVLRDCLSSMENDLMMLAGLRDGHRLSIQALQESKI